MSRITLTFPLQAGWLYRERACAACQDSLRSVCHIEVRPPHVTVLVTSLLPLFEIVPFALLRRIPAVRLPKSGFAGALIS